jgi:hypothetical protein
MAMALGNLIDARSFSVCGLSAVNGMFKGLGDVLAEGLGIRAFVGGEVWKVPVRLGELVDGLGIDVVVGVELADEGEGADEV